ncbi:DNA-binding CsgD family transcriptional regulator [Sphingopyxis sp. OAS728]|nr:DNA-binding CsgD family transcriptional regulator [Sphingopyxis sp. OAS728]
MRRLVGGPPVSPYTGRAAHPLSPLTGRQLECLAWISESKSSTDIDAILGISPRTVDYHVAEICRRLNIRTRMQAVKQAVTLGWIEI